MYKGYRQQAHNLEYRVKDLIDDKNHPQARVLREEVRRLTEDFEQQKLPRTIEQRIDTIQNQLKQEQSRQAYMSVGDSVALHENMKHMREGIRRFPHY